jgi:hypothetical protein
MSGTAFSPTDAMPLTARAKLLLPVESVVSLVLIVLVTARAVKRSRLSGGSQLPWGAVSSSAPTLTSAASHAAGTDQQTTLQGRMLRQHTQRRRR